jgi:hypothetical protein
VKITDCYYNVGDGWAGILTLLHVELMQVFPDYQADQVKEKFGGLRAYISFPKGTPDVIRDTCLALEHKYEMMSQFVCEICGKRGSNQENSRGWQATRCDACRAADAARSE